MRLSIAMAFLAVSAINSWVLSAPRGPVPLGALVGSANHCKDDCDAAATTTKNECLHNGAADPCSTITCIKNVIKLPKCTKLDSGGADCKTKIGEGIVQTNYDQPCSGTSGWETIVFQAKSECAPKVAATLRCLTDSCGSGMGYASVPRNSSVCDK